MQTLSPRRALNPSSRVISELEAMSQYLAKQHTMDLLRFITCGSVDNGKSTLIGRMLWEAQQIFNDQLMDLQHDSRKHGTQGESIDFALLVDGLTAEREQGITIDVAYRFFATEKRKFIVADSPGHEQYTRNMVTAASTADVAVILIDATKGILTQTRRHAYLTSLMGIKTVVLAINKMDLMAYSKDVFYQIYNEFKAAVENFGFTNTIAIPLSALNGINITKKAQETPWYDGPSLLTCLESIETQKSASTRFVFPVQWVNRPNADFRGYSGTIAEGSVTVGDEVRITHSGHTAKVQRIVTMDGDLEKADAGNAVTLTLDKEIDISRGDVISLTKQPIEVADHFEVTIIWMDASEGYAGRSYVLKLASQEVTASISTIKYRINVNNLAHEAVTKLTLNDISVCNLSTDKPIAFDHFTGSKTLGSFILIDRYTNATVAAGIIHHSLHRSKHVYRQAFAISRPQRERLNGHKGKVIWFTGLSGAGKSTIANALEVELHQKKYHTYLLDGDNVRQGLNKDLGFTDADRVENIRRVTEVAKLLLDAGLIVIAAFISPFRRERAMMREVLGEENFVEVYMNTPLEVCESRDSKGLYKKSRAAQLPNMPGLTSSYEVPENPDIELDGKLEVNDSVQKILTLLNL